MHPHAMKPRKSTRPNSPAKPFIGRPIRVSHDAPINILIENLIASVASAGIKVLGPRLYPILKKVLSDVSITADSALLVFLLKKIWPIGYDEQDLKNWADMFIADYHAVEEQVDGGASIQRDRRESAVLDEARKLFDDIDNQTEEETVEKSVTLGSKDSVDDDDDDDDMPNSQDLAFLDDEFESEEMQKFADYITDMEQDDLEHVSSIMIVSPRHRVTASCFCLFAKDPSKKFFLPLRGEPFWGGAVRRK